MIAWDVYYYILTVMASMLGHYGSSLGLLAPGDPNQLGLPNGIRLVNKRTTYYVVVLRDNNFCFRMKSEFIREVQRAIDRYCYQTWMQKPFILDVKPYPDGSIVLAMTM